MLTFIFEQLLNSAETDGQAIRAIRTLYDLRLAQSPIFQKRKHGPALQLNSPRELKRYDEYGGITIMAGAAST